MNATIEIASYTNQFAAIRAIKGLDASKLLADLQRKNVFHRGMVGQRSTHLLEWERIEGFRAYCAKHGIETVRPA